MTACVQHWLLQVFSFFGVVVLILCVILFSFGLFGFLEGGLRVLLSFCVVFWFCFAFL